MSLQISSAAEDLHPLGPSANAVTGNRPMPDTAVPSSRSLFHPAVAPPTPSDRKLALVHRQNAHQHSTPVQGSTEVVPVHTPALPLTPSHSARQLLTPLVIHPSTHPSDPPSLAPGVEGLRFVLGLSTKTMSPTQALTALAEGHLQCAVTGAAFQHLLESSDLDALEIVMRSVVVFARMQPHQKGRVVDLLTIKGVHQMHNGSSRHVQVGALQQMLLLCLLCMLLSCLPCILLPAMHAAAVSAVLVMHAYAMTAVHAAAVPAIYVTAVSAAHVAVVPAILWRRELNML